jgi:TonB family protein
MIFRVAVLLTAAAVGTRGAAQLQEASDVVAESYVEPVRIESHPPKYPVSALQKGREGWVMLSFVVDEAGAVAEPMIEDSSGIEVLELAALEAVRRWRYEPAKRNGEAVAHSMTKSRIRFKFEGAQDGARASFVAQYRKITDLIEARDFAAAKSLLDEMEFRGRINLYEDAFFWWLKYGYLDAVESPDSAAKIEALRLAIGYEEDYLPADQFVAASQALYVLEVRAGDYSDAFQTLARLKASRTAKSSKHYETVVAALTPSAGEILQAINGRGLLRVHAEIGRHDYWVHSLLRRSFAMADIKGRVDVVDIRCDRGTKRYDSFPMDAVWQVPETWGACAVYIKGEPGTSFAFDEYPLGAKAATIQ